MSTLNCPGHYFVGLFYLSHFCSFLFFTRPEQIKKKITTTIVTIEHVTVGWFRLMNTENRIRKLKKPRRRRCLCSLFGGPCFLAVVFILCTVCVCVCVPVEWLVRRAASASKRRPFLFFLSRFFIRPYTTQHNTTGNQIWLASLSSSHQQPCQTMDRVAPRPHSTVCALLSNVGSFDEQHKRTQAERASGWNKGRRIHTKKRVWWKGVCVFLFSVCLYSRWIAKHKHTRHYSSLEINALFGLSKTKNPQ